jgi:phospho-N-acetylmuramoyl-pentapeptide-transferase
MGQLLTASVVAFLLAVGLSRALRRSLFWLSSREHKVGKEKIHRLFPKPRRPLGGGLAMMVSVTLALLVVPRFWGSAPPPAALWTLSLAWAYALIGLADDLKKALGRGMDERSKLLLQVIAACAFSIACWRWGGLHVVRVPFADQPVDFGTLYIPFLMLVILAAANAVNLADGVDGLAGGAAVIALVGLAGVGLISRGHAMGATCWPLIGAILGFLVYNLPPARLLMGDTGALGIGAALAGLAAFGRAELWLPLLAAPFVVDAASVLVQMGTVRGLWRVFRPLRHQTTEKARPFLCTPLHHHFQWLGWSEWPVLALFWGFGAVMAGWAVLSLWSAALWLMGLAALALFLVGAALQKQVRANHFLGLRSRPGESAVLALYRGLPVELLGRPLYGLHYETSITEEMLGGATVESILWRPITEVEAHVVLGKIYADQRLLELALAEWEQVPTRNLLIRPGVMLRLARIYYGRDRLLEAIKLWEQLPASRLREMPNVREVVRSAKLRLADLASKAHRQSIRTMAAAERTGEIPERLEAELLAARRLNRDLLSLLLYERDKLRGQPADPQAARARRELLLRTRNSVLAKANELDEALGKLARTVPMPQAGRPGDGAPTAAADPAQRAAQELHVNKDALARLIAPAGRGRVEVRGAAVHPKASRNTVFRIGLGWSESGPATVIAKRYAADRIAFFSACYRRERGVLELLHSYRCAVPRVYGGELTDDQAILVMQDLGDETLAERLEASEGAAKEQWLYSAVMALVDLHAVTQAHLRELTDEIRKLDKETLGPDYYANALRIALDRIAAIGDRAIGEGEWQRIAEQSRPLVDFLCARPAGFIHFEFTPHHLLVTESGLHVFDFEQATIGPAEFDLAALLAQPESGLGAEGWNAMVAHYATAAGERGLPSTGPDGMPRAVAYAALLKCLVYAGAAGNFLEKFGGEHHLQRFHYYLDRCQDIMSRWAPLRPLGQLLGPRFRAARGAGARSQGSPPAAGQRPAGAPG